MLQLKNTTKEGQNVILRRKKLQLTQSTKLFLNLKNCAVQGNAHHQAKNSMICFLLSIIYIMIYNLLAIYLLCAGNIPDADACAATC